MGTMHLKDRIINSVDITAIGMSAINIAYKCNEFGVSQPFQIGKIKITPFFRKYL